MNGWEFLSELKKDPALKDIPVLVISSSRESKDLEAANSFEVKHFIEKPLNSNQFTLLENFLRDIWIEKFGSDNGHLKGTF
jgi:CheY-like chemotaxis protein